MKSIYQSRRLIFKQKGTKLYGRFDLFDFEGKVLMRDVDTGELRMFDNEEDIGKVFELQ